MSVVYLLDNLDSFSYNLVDEVAQLGFSLKLYRNTVPASYIFEKMQQEQQPVVLLLSPGPGAPHKRVQCRSSFRFVPANFLCSVFV